jgi:DNA-binding GntR family transcriptional regulator
MSTFGSEDSAGLRRTTTRALIDRLRQEIHAGEFQQGDRLRQGELAARFGVSTTPVREALSALQAEGIVSVDPHRGAVVVRPTAEDVRESFEIREVLEILAVKHAVPLIDDSTLDRLQALLIQMRSASTYSGWAEMNEEFHSSLYRASGRQRLCALIDAMRASSQYFIHLALSGAVPGAEVESEHQAILDACLARDVRAATKALHRHLGTTAERTLSHLAEEMMSTA